MKISKAVIFPLVCGALWFCTGCNEQTADAEEPTIFTASPDAPPIVEAEDSADSGAPAAPGTNAVKVVKPAEVAETVKISPALEELAKLVQAGVPEDVILAYITNSTQPFNLGSDQIVYLNDLGISSTVLTAAIQHDALPEIAAKKRIGTPEPAPVEVAAAPPVTNVTPPATTQPVTAPLVPPEGYAVAQAPTQVVAPYYSSLAPYGNWVEVDGYGLCWQPTVTIVNTSWRPYCDRGRWVWSDYGWYWYSDYSWGWAPFHYGRWCSYPRLGWIWVPGSVWGPSWVSWRHTRDHCAWAPLGPTVSVSIGIGAIHASHWSVVPTRHFADRNPQQHIVRGSVAASVLKAATPSPTGIPADRIARLTGTQVPKAKIVDAPLPTGRTARAERLEGSGSSLRVARPAPLAVAAVSSSAPNEVKRERGATVFPAARTQSSLPSNLAESGVKSTTASSVPVQTKNEPKTVPSTTGSRTDSSANGGKPRVDSPKTASPPARGLAENAAKAGSVAPNEGAKTEPPKKTIVPAPKITSQKEANSQPHQGSVPQNPSLVSVGKAVTPLPPRVENSTKNSTADRNDGPSSLGNLRKTAPPGSIIMGRETPANQSISRPIGTPTTSTRQPASPLAQVETAPSRSIAAPSEVSPAPRSINPAPGAVRSESPRPSFARPEAPRAIAPAASVAAPPAYRAQPSIPPAIRSEAVRPSAGPPPAIRSGPPTVSGPPPSIAPAIRSAPAPSGRSDVQSSGRGNGGGSGGGGGGGRGRNGRGD